MNFGNFNENKSDFELPIHPDTLSKGAKAFLTVVSAVLMALCGYCLLVGIVANDVNLLSSAALLGFFLFFIIGGMTALLVLEAPGLAPLSPILAFVAVFSYFVVNSGGFRVAFLFGSLFSLLPFVFGLFLALAMKKGVNRSGAILSSAVCGGIFVLAVLMLSVCLAGGKIDGESLLSFVDQLRDGMREYFDAQLLMIKENFPQTDVSGIDATSLANGIINLLPATVVLYFSVAAFFTNLSLLALLRIYDLYHKTELHDREFKVSVVTAVVFAASYLLAAFMGEGPALAVMDNLYLILMPPMAVVGLMSCLPKRDGNGVKVGCFPLVISIPILFILPAVGILLLAFFGTIFTIKEAVKKQKKSEK